MLDAKRLHRWQMIILTITLMSKLCLAADWYGFAAVISFVSADLGMDKAQAGFAQGAIAITYGLGMFFWSPLTTRLSGRLFYTLGMAVTGVAMLIQMAIHDMFWLVILRLIVGFFEAGVWMGGIKLLFGWFPSDKRGTAIGIVLGAFSLAITLDFALGIPITQIYGWRVFFGGLGVFTLLVTVVGGALALPGPEAIGLTAIAVEQGAVAPSGRTLPMSILFKSPWLYVGGLAIFGDTFALAATATWVVPAFVDVQHMPISYGAIIGTVMGLSQVVFLIIGGRLSDRMSRITVIKVGAVLGILSALLFTLATFLAMPLIMLIAISALSGVAVFSGGAIFSMLGEKFPTELGTAATGYAEVFGLASTFAAPALMGLVVRETSSFFLAFVAFSVAEIAILALIVLLSAGYGKRAKQDKLEPVPVSEA